MRVSLRMSYEMNRELAEDHGLSLADYTVLVALSNAPGGRQQLSDLATTIGWERTRLSHHLQRMSRRGLTERHPSTTDGRATDALLTAQGRTALEAAAPDHVDVVRSLFFGALEDHDAEVLAELLERVHTHLESRGSRPESLSRRNP